MRRPARLLAGLCAALAAGSLAVPTAGAAGDDTVDRHRQVFLDRAGDGEDLLDAGGARHRTWQERLADLRRVAYRTPDDVGGLLSVGAGFERLRGPRAAVAQRVQTYLWDPERDRTWQLTGTSRGTASLVFLGEGGERIRPAVLEVETQPGDGGSLEVSLSTEWLDASVVRLHTVAEVQRAADDTAESRRLRIGPTD